MLSLDRYDGLTLTIGWLNPASRTKNLYRLIQRWPLDAKYCVKYFSTAACCISGVSAMVRSLITWAISCSGLSMLVGKTGESSQYYHGHTRVTECDDRQNM